MRAREWHIYTLCDPVTEQVRYVGWSFLPKRRLVGHLWRARSGRERSHKANWLRSLEESGLAPLLRIVESGTSERGWATAEPAWIRHYTNIGCRLTNLTLGGEGVVGLKYSAESRAKMSAAKRGRKLSPEHIKKLGDATRGRKRPPHVREAISRAQRGKTLSAETKAKLSVACTGYKHTEQAKAKIVAALRKRDSSSFLDAGSAARRGKPLSDAHKSKLRAAKLGRNLTEEHKAKIRGNGGWKHTPESLEKIRAARRARAAEQLTRKTDG